MILYVDHEHEMGRTAAWGTKIMAGRMKVKYRVEEITGEACLIAHYPKVNPAFLRKWGVKAVLISGSGTDPEHYAEADLAGLHAVYHAGEWPVLALCGGWQFMAHAFGADITPLGPLPPGAPPLEDEVIFRTGMKQEFGFKPVRIIEPHPLFEDLPETPVFWHAHYMEIKTLPPNFRCFAETDLCRVQMAAHTTLPLYGTQFHPEHYDNMCPDGRRVLENFVRLAYSK